jgi:hypothetical protein
MQKLGQDIVRLRFAQYRIYGGVIFRTQSCLGEHVVSFPQRNFSETILNQVVTQLYCSIAKKPGQSLPAAADKPFRLRNIKNCKSNICGYFFSLSSGAGGTIPLLRLCSVQVQPDISMSGKIVKK